jgi:hypothetical protein
MFNIGDLVTRFTRSIASPLLSDDEDSFGPQSISYNVNMGTPEKSTKNSSPPGGGSRGNRRGGGGGARARSTSKSRNQETDWMDKINQIYNLCTDTKQEVTQITAKLESTSSDVAEVKASVQKVEGRLDVVETETKTLSEKVAAVEQGNKEMEQRLEERLLKKLSQPRQPDEASSHQNPVSQSSKFLERIAARQPAEGQTVPNPESQFSAVFADVPETYSEETCSTRSPRGLRRSSS